MNQNPQYPECSAVKAITDCRQVVESLIGAPNYRHSKYSQYRSPFRAEKEPSFTVYADGWRDWGTGDHGDVFDFLARHQGMTLPQAIQYLTGPALALAVNRPAQPVAIAQLAQDSAWQLVMSKLAQDSQRVLWSPAGAKALEYLRTVRGLADETIRAAQLGYNPRWTLIPWQGTEKVAPGIVLPWFDGAQLTGFEVRAFPDKGKQPKYLLFGHRGQYGNLTGDKPALLTEGVFDCLLAAQTTGPALDVVTFGSAASTPSAEALAGLRSAPYVLGILDNDDAGQQAAAKFAEALGGKFYPVTLPDGKDITEFVMSTGGDLRALLGAAVKQLEETRARLDLARFTVADGLRSTALNAKLAAALIVYELVHAGIRAGELKPGEAFSYSLLLEVSQRLKLGLDKSVIQRGLKQGVDCFVSKSVKGYPTKEKSTEDSPYTDFEISPAGRQFYTLLPIGQVKRNLEDRAWYRILEKYFSLAGENPVLPVLKREMFASLGDESEAVYTELVKLAAPVLAHQDNRRAQMRLKMARGDCQKLRAQLNEPHSTPLPSGWSNGVQYRAIYLRALHDQDASPKSYRDIARITGVNANDTKAVLQRAGLENRDRFAVVPVSAKGNVKAQLIQAAKGRGKLYGVIALKNDKPEPFFSDDLNELVSVTTDMLRQGAEVSVKLRLPSEQVIVRAISQVEPAAASQVGPAAASQVGPAAASQVEKPSRGKVKRYTGPGYDPDYVRDLVLKIHFRLTGEIVSQPDMLTLKDAVDLVRLQSPAIEAHQAETAPALDATPVQACTYSDAFMAWMDFYKPQAWSSYR